MEPKRHFIPFQIEVFRRPRRWLRWCWGLGAALVAAALSWMLLQPSREPAHQPAPQAHAAHPDGPPWRLGNADARFTATLYADLECPYCKEYSPKLRQWLGTQQDVSLQWHHLPLAAHEPAASAEARLAECAGETAGHAGFWKAADWVYAHTRSDGQGVPDRLRYPELTPATEQCLSSDRPDAAIRQQSAEAAKSGVAATPSLRLHDRVTGKSVLLQGPIEGDALLSAMDLLAASGPSSASAPTPAHPTSEMPADVVGDMPR